MSRILLFCFFVSISFHAISQNEFSTRFPIPPTKSSRFAISIGAGPSISLGKWAEKITGSAKSGTAGGGVAGMVAVEAKIWKPFGFIVQAMYNDNATREEPIIRRVQEKYGIQSPVITTERWQAITVLAGPTLKMIDRRFKLEGRIVGGYVSTTSPAFTVDGIAANRQVHIETDPKKGADFCYGAGTTVGLALSERIHFITTADAVYATVIFSDLTSRGSTAGVTLPLPTEPQEMKVGLLNVTGGLRFTF